MKRMPYVLCVSPLLPLLLTLVAILRSAQNPGLPAEPDQQVKNPCNRAPLVITRATLWTADGLIENSEVVFAGGRVAAVGKSGALARPPGAQLIDAGGDTLAPGLI